jgi:hypothetical protein
MTRRRGRGKGGVHWDEKRQRFIASVTVGYTPAGKRIVRRGSGKTEAQARANTAPHCPRPRAVWP